MYKLETNRQQPKGKGVERYDDAPTSKLIAGHLTRYVHQLDDFLLRRVPRSSEWKKEHALITVSHLENWANGSNFTPDLFWKGIVEGLTNFHTGAGQTIDISDTLHDWFAGVAEEFKSRKIDAYSAKFITEGESVLLEELKKVGTMKKTDQIRKSIASMYKDLVLNENLSGGWNQKHVDFVEHIRTSADDSGFVADVIADFTDPDLGVSSPYAAHMQVDGRHIFEIELERFTTSEAFKTQQTKQKAKLLQEANSTIPQAFKSVDTDADPRVAPALQGAYGQITSAVVDADYIKYKIRTLSAAYPAQVTLSATDEKRLGDVQQIKVPKAKSEDDKRAEYVAAGLNEELNTLLTMLGDHVMGTGGLLALKEDEARGVQSVAETITQQYELYLSFIETSGQPMLKSIFIEKARENVLKALESSAYPELASLYMDLVENVGEDGKAKLYERKFSYVDESEVMDVAQGIIDDLSKKLLHPVYGVQEARSLESAFMLEADDLVKYVSQLNPQLGSAIAHAAEKLLQTVSQEGTTEQKAQGLKAFYTKIQEGFRESVAIDAVQGLCKETTDEDILAELKTMESQGALPPDIAEKMKAVGKEDKIPENIDQEFLLIVRETLENRAANTFWNDVVGKVTDPVFGASGSKIDIAHEETDLIAKIEGELATKSAEFQRRYIKEGLVVMLNSFGDLKERGNHDAIAALQTMVQSLVLDKPELLKGKTALLVSWMEKPEELTEMFAKLSNETYGFGSAFSVYGELRGLIVDFITTAESFSKESATDSASGQTQYTAFKILEDNIVEAIRTVTDTDLQTELSDLYSTATDKLGKRAMRYLAQGKYIQEAQEIIQNPTIDEEVLVEMEKRFHKSFSDLASLSNLKGAEQEEYEKIASDVANSELQGLWAKYWENYYDITCGNDTSQGKPGSLIAKAEANHKAFQEALSHEDSSYVCSFLDAAVTAGFEKFRQAKDQDVQKRIGFELFALLGNSESILVQSLKARENGEKGEFGAKSVRTLGAVQVAFIRKMIADPDLMQIAFQYIETKAPEGKRKDAEELSLCMEVLMTSRDSQFQRSGKTKYTEEGLEEVVKGNPPSPKVLGKIEAALLASVESATNNLEGDNPELNVIFELLAAIDTFSPSVLTRLGFAADDLRDIKNTRKQNTLEVKKAVAALEEANLSPEEVFSRIYTSTGKHYFGNDFAPHFSEEIKEIIRSGIAPEGPKKNLLNRVLTYRDDVCQVVKTPPGLQLFFGEDWQPSAVPHLRSTFDKYLAGFDRRLHNKNIKHTGAKNAVATELLGISMIFETFAGQSDEAKRGPHLQFIQTLSNIIIDGMNAKENRKYSAELHKVAEYILRESVPYWSKEFIKDFFTVMTTRAQNVNGSWVESGRWKDMCDMVVVLDENHKPLAKDGKIAMTSEGKMVREELAEMAVDATLAVLSGYTFMGGPQNIRLASSIVNGTRLADMDEVPLEVAPQKNNFIMQSIGAVNWYGMPRHKKTLVRILEKLGREEALLIGQSKYMRPPQDVEELVGQSKQIAGAMAEDIKTIFVEYANALQAVQTGITPIFKQNEDGTFTIEGLPNDSSLKTIIEDHEQEIINEAVNQSAYGGVQKKAREALKGLTMDKIKKMDGTSLLKVIMQTAVAGSGGNKILEDLVDVFEKLVSQVNGQKNGAVPVYGDDSFSLFIHRLQTDTGIASMLSTMNAQGERVGSIVEATMNSIVGLRKDLLSMAETIAKASGAEDTAATAEEVTQVLLKQIIGVVQDETATQRVVGLMKQAQADMHKKEAEVWEKAHEALTEKRKKHVGEEVEDLYVRAEREMNEMRLRRDQFYSSREEIVTAMNTAIGSASKDMVEVVGEATKLNMKKYPKYIAWLNTTLNRDAEAQEGSVNIQARLTSYAEYCNRHTSAQFGAIQHGAAAIASLSVQPRNMAWTSKELLRIHGLVMEDSKIRALTKEELAAELVQEQLL